ncbi:MAG: hypothetical protein DLM72_09300 [Candidatus Nitrosopolaris wilkensis]|nr:MAG: hypothetical protein DLM72_09300 [Candidatus Nitrosopolaris wilkensis]
MKNLIILRGPMGSGKTEVGQYLRGALEDSVLVDLDLNANGPLESIDEALGKKNVVAELFHGNSHTTDPQWIKAFQERDYNILSVILNTKLETCINRVLVKRKDKRTIDEVKQYYDFFHENLKPVFKIRAGVEEISIDTDEKEAEQVADEILGYIKQKSHH